MEIAKDTTKEKNNKERHKFKEMWERWMVEE
jgi:hypothetical protein